MASVTSQGLKKKRNHDEDGLHTGTILHAITIILLFVLLVVTVLFRGDNSAKTKMRQIHGSIPHRCGTAPQTAGEQSETPAAGQTPGAIESAACFPHYTNTFPVHWAHFPDLVETEYSRNQQVVLPGNFGIGSSAVAVWIGDWLVLDTALSRINSFGSHDVFQVKNICSQLVTYAVSSYFPYLQIEKVVSSKDICAFLKDYQQKKVACGHAVVFVDSDGNTLALKIRFGS